MAPKFAEEKRGDSKAGRYEGNRVEGGDSLVQPVCYGREPLYYVFVEHGNQSGKSDDDDEYNVVHCGLRVS